MMQMVRELSLLLSVWSFARRRVRKGYWADAQQWLQARSDAGSFVRLTPLALLLPCEARLALHPI
jgi:hypothetical protein